MRKLGILVLSLIAGFVGNLATAHATNAPPSLTATPVPKMTSTSTPTEASFITTTGGFFALSVADINATAEWYS